VEEELSPYRSKQVLRAEISGPEVRLEPSQAQAIAIVFHELTTNAVKYGALSITAGRIRVDWFLAENGRLLLPWAELDGPSTEAPRHEGFGTRVITQVVHHQLKGDVRFHWRTEGLLCEIGLPNLMFPATQHPDVPLVPSEETG